LAADLRARAEPGVLDVVGGFDSVLVEFDPGLVEAGPLAERLAGVRARPRRRAGRHHVLKVAFDGPDLDEVGALSGLGAGGVRRTLARTRLKVAVLGFAPGFAYLAGLGGPLAVVERRATPRARVPAGSVAVAGGFCAVYPFATPGGWHLVGRTGASLFDADAPPYALLAPGDTVSFEEVDPAEVAAGDAARPPRAPLRHRRPVFVVERPGTATALQDLGRLGVAHLGVPRAGAADPVAYALANALVGNPPEAACLELTATGPVLRCRAEAHVALVGSGAAALLDGRPVTAGRVVPVAPGQLLEVPSTGVALRAYLALAGGFDGPVILGSRGSDRLVGLGPGPIVAGDELGAEGPAGRLADHLVPGEMAEPGGQWTLRVLRHPGPTAGAEVFGRSFVVDETSDRVGIRLHPEGPPVQAVAPLAHSIPTTVGTVQLPPDGNPIVLLPDRATLGGYPVLGVVVSADRAVLGRVRPGDRIRLVEVSAAEADGARRSLARSLAGAVVGTYPRRLG
jgi:KipI family sensor histidine kinase inhibitor